MTDTELKSCIGTIEMLRRLAYNIHGVMDVIDADNCEKIIKVLSDIPKYKDAYGKGWIDGAKASYEHLKMCEEELSGDLIQRRAVLDTIHRFFTEEVDKIPTKKTEDGEVLIMCRAQPLFAMNKAICKRIKALQAVNPQEPYDFAKWVATEIFDDNWEYNKDAFAEIACRKLAKLGIVRAKGDEWELVDPQERSDKE